MAEKRKPRAAKGQDAAAAVPPRSVEELVFSYLTHRKVIGYLGVTLPFIMFLGGLRFFQTTLQDSISSYYYTYMRDVFVGALWTIGAFLFSYRGYDYLDEIATDAAGIFAVGISIFPTAPAGASSDLVLSISSVHGVFAVLFFLTLSYISFFLFTQTDPKGPRSRRKPQRDLVYRICGGVMLAAIAAGALYLYVPNLQASFPSAAYHPIFWVEAIADIAFGVSWAIKGQALLKDDAQFLQKQ